MRGRQEVVVGRQWCQEGTCNVTANKTEPIKFEFQKTFFTVFLPPDVEAFFKEENVLDEVVRELSKPPTRLGPGDNGLLWGYGGDPKFTFLWKVSNASYEASLPMKDMYSFSAGTEETKAKAYSDLHAVVEAVMEKVAALDRGVIVTLSEDQDQNWWNLNFVKSAPPYREAEIARALAKYEARGRLPAHHFLEKNNGTTGCILGKGWSSGKAGWKDGTTVVRVPVGEQLNLYIFLSEGLEQALKGEKLRTVVQTLGSAPTEPAWNGTGWRVDWGNTTEHVFANVTKGNITYNFHLPKSVGEALSDQGAKGELDGLLQAGVREAARLHLVKTLGT